MPFSIDFQEVLQNIIYMAVAYVLAMPVVWDRETDRTQCRSAHLPLVAWDRFEIALVLSLVNFLTLWLMLLLKKQREEKTRSAD